MDCLMEADVHSTFYCQQAHFIYIDGSKYYSPLTLTSTAKCFPNGVINAEHEDNNPTSHQCRVQIMADPTSLKRLRTSTMACQHDTATWRATKDRNQAKQHTIQRNKTERSETKQFDH